MSLKWRILVMLSCGIVRKISEYMQCKEIVMDYICNLSWACAYNWNPSALFSHQLHSFWLEAAPLLIITKVVLCSPGGVQKETRL